MKLRTTGTFQKPKMITAIATIYVNREIMSLHFVV